MTSQNDMIDQKVVAAHQWVIDKTQRAPEWWGEHLPWAFGIFNAIAYILGNPGNIQPLLLGIIAVASAGMLFLSRMPETLSWIASKGIVRWFVWFDLVTRVMQFAKDPSNWRAAYFLSAVVALVFFYFAICKPPRLRKHRGASADETDGPAQMTQLTPAE